MRNTLLSLTAVAGLFAAGVATSAAAAPVRAEIAPAAAPMVQHVDYYGYHDHGRRDWHRHEVRHEIHRWIRHHS